MAWQKGQSGNPKGRPKGAREKRLKWMLSHERELQERVVKDALAGNTRAMQIVADRLWPKIRPEALPVAAGKATGNIATQGEQILTAALEGHMPPDTARELLAGLADLARIREFVEIENRLRALEGRREAPPWDKDDDDEPLPIRGKRRRSKRDETRH